MLRLTTVAVSLLVSCCLAHAQLVATPRTLRPVQDAAMVVDDRGSRLEVYPAQRAAAASSLDGRAQRQVSASAVSAPITASQMGVVFNHSMQSEGFITGEIAFALKTGVKADGATFPAAAYPGLSKLTGPNVYLVKAPTPSAFVATLKLLQARADLEWVEPAIQFEAQAPSIAK